MKKRTLCLMLCLLCLLSLPGRAESFTGGSGWNVVFTPDKELVSSFRSSEIAEAVGGLQPGDTILFTISIANSYPEQIAWYMSNKVLYSLEDRSSNLATAGGAYSYTLVYTDAAGVKNVLFSSDTIGGDDGKGGREGLHKATGALEDFFYLDSLDQHASGVITLEVGLEGETQGNDYQDTLADLAMSFAVELSGDGNDKRIIVMTGDDGRLPLYYVLMAVSGVLLLALAFDGVRRRRRERRRDAE